MAASRRRTAKSKNEDAVAWKGSFVIATEQGGYYLSQSQQAEELATVEQIRHQCGCRWFGCRCH